MRGWLKNISQQLQADRRWPPLIPTDLELLEHIYTRYYERYLAFNENPSIRQTKIAVPIDIQAIAQELDTDQDVVFGKLYYDLEHRYGYKRESGESVSLFFHDLGTGEKREIHLINFPYMSSILADLQREHWRESSSLRIAWISLGVSVLALIVSFISAVKS